MDDGAATTPATGDTGKISSHWMDFIKVFLTVSAPVVIYLLGANITKLDQARQERQHNLTEQNALLRWKTDNQRNDLRHKDEQNRIALKARADAEAAAGEREAQARREDALRNEARIREDSVAKQQALEREAVRLDHAYAQQQQALTAFSKAMADRYAMLLMVNDLLRREAADPKQEYAQTKERWRAYRISVTDWEATGARSLSVFRRYMGPNETEDTNRYLGRLRSITYNTDACFDSIVSHLPRSPPPMQSCTENMLKELDSSIAEFTWQTSIRTVQRADSQPSRGVAPLLTAN